MQLLIWDSHLLSEQTLLMNSWLMESQLHIAASSARATLFVRAQLVAHHMNSSPNTHAADSQDTLLVHVLLRLTHS